MTNSPLPDIEFVIPYFGSRPLLEEAVASVLSQSDPRWQLRVVEDGPQDQGVEEWITGLEDPRVCHELNASNLGVAGNFQRCLELGSSDWIVFLGCDDILLPTYVQRVREAIHRHPGVAVIQPGIQVIDSLGARAMPLGDRIKRRLRPRDIHERELGGESAVASLMRGNWTYFPSLCWRRERIQPIGFRQDLPTTLDLALLLELLFRDELLVSIVDNVFQYRRHDHSASSLAARTTLRFSEEARLFREVESRCQELGWGRAARASRVHLSSRLHAGLVAFRALRVGDRVGARLAASHVVSACRSGATA